MSVVRRLEVVSISEVESVLNQNALPSHRRENNYNVLLIPVGTTGCRYYQLELS